MKYHYCYRITNKKLSKHYYGVRSSKCKPKEDLGIRYFSSSTDHMFILDQKENKDDYKYKVVGIFNNRVEAELFEIKLHSKFGVEKNENFYNKYEANTSGFSMENRKHSEEAKNKMKELATGRNRTIESRKKQSESISGENNHLFGKKGESHPKFGYKMTPEQKQEVSDRNSGFIWGGKKICEFCEKEVSAGNYKRWHGSNCKYK